MAEAINNTEIEVEKKGGSNMVLFIILIAGAIAGYMLLNSDDEVLNDANKAQQTQMANQKSATKTVRGTNYSEIGQMYPMSSFVVNLYSESGSRYLKTTLNLELASEDLAMELDAKVPLIRDIIIKTLSAKTYEEISTIKGKENLKDEIVIGINEVVSDGHVNNIFFTDFVIQ